MNDLYKEMQEAVDMLLPYTEKRAKPQVGIILGSGLGQMVDIIENAVSIPYSKIPNFKTSTAPGHSGNLIIGEIDDIGVVAMQGRFHYYEGYTMQEVTFPIRVMKALGVERLLVSNAAGGLNPSFKVGDLMIITDHINFMPNPLIGPNFKHHGVRFPDMTNVYSGKLKAYANAKAAELGVFLQSGVYVAETGPTYETPAEYKMFAALGGDAIGMSTVPEVIVGRHCKMEIFGMSVITNSANDLGEGYENNEQDVIDAAQNASNIMVDIFRALVSAPF